MDSAEEKKNIEMEPNLPVMAKKLCHIVRVIFFMIKKGISKGKLLIHLKYFMMKRTKIAGKAIQNLMLQHSISAFSATSSTTAGLPFPEPLDEYEFSCSNSPANYPHFHLPFHKRKSSHHSKKSNNSLPKLTEEDDVAMHAVIKALEMIHSAAASPALPGFGRSPAVRQLRITDSPFPLKDVDEDSHVDEAAEEFIQKFYKNLRRQNALGAN